MTKRGKVNKLIPMNRFGKSGDLESVFGDPDKLVAVTE